MKLTVISFRPFTSPYLSSLLLPCVSSSRDTTFASWFRRFENIVTWPEGNTLPVFGREKAGVGSGGMWADLGRGGITGASGVWTWRDKLLIEEETKPESLKVLWLRLMEVPHDDAVMQWGTKRDDNGAS